MLSEESLTIFAEDTEGNISNTILFVPPPIRPAPNNLTPEGQGVLTDRIMSHEWIEFITITSRGGNVFHLVVDHTRENNNVYFLNSVTEWDLMMLAEQAETVMPPINTQTFSPVAETESPPETLRPTPRPSEEESPPSGKRSISSSLILVGLFALAGVGVALWKINAIKKQKAEANKSDDTEYEDDEYEDFGDEESDESPDDNADINELQHGIEGYESGKTEMIEVTMGELTAEVYE
jgi:hypothetical protein